MAPAHRSTRDDQSSKNARTQRLTGILIGAFVTALFAVMIATNGQPPRSGPAPVAAASAEPTGTGAESESESETEPAPESGYPEEEWPQELEPLPEEGVPDDVSGDVLDEVPGDVSAPEEPGGTPVGQDEEPGADPAPAATPTEPAPPGGRAEDSGTTCAFSTDRATVIAQGMTGLRVSQAQCLLKEHYGYKLAVDGVFGPATDQAVRATQRCTGLDVDGKVGPRTWRALHSPQAACRAA
ncbi:peptidoglycan-binding protein [Streptomyces sp. NPDC000410]|uniref:peptidoglycan-binding domain-containing protein n=1 Tax=Streptomyces sp. NPDC000410 TaxID=3154254 RepID=UPI003329C634